MFPFALMLLTLSTNTTAPVDGSAFTLVVPATDENDLPILFGVNTTLVVSGTSGASVQITVETSWDGTNWVEIAAGTAVTADGTLNENILLTNKLIGPRVRARLKKTGTATINPVRVRLVATRQFKSI